jgi:putative ABC transport system permease protein
MLRNYLKVCFRSLAANKLYSFISIGGLAIGIATSILILLWVDFKYSYNKFFPNHKQLYQLKLNIENNGVIVTEDNQSVLTYMALRDADSRIKNTCITSTTYGHSLKYGNKDIGKEVLAVSEEFLEMFRPPMLIGTVHSLDDSYSILLGESTAKEIFGDQDPIGQFIQVDYDKEFKVTGIFKDIPRNSTFWFHALIPMWGGQRMSYG